MAAGLAVGVVRDNEIVYAKGFGVRSIETQEPVTTASLFCVASVSKPFVATAIMQLVEQGEIDLDGLVVDYLPYFRLDDERYQEITIQQMLSHVSGMPDLISYPWLQPEYDDEALERYVRSLDNEKLEFAPGDRFAYSDTAYDVLGDVIAKVSGQLFEAYVKDHILIPLEMYNSTFLKQDVPPELATTPHRTGRISTVYPYHRAHAPSVTLHSNVLEMSNWAIANLARGTFKDKQILQASSYDLLWRPYVEVEESLSIGLGWWIQMYEGQKVIFHAGKIIGFRALVTMLPEESMAVIVLANDESAPVGYIENTVFDIMFGVEP